MESDVIWMILFFHQNDIFKLRLEQGFWEYTKICSISYTTEGIWAPKIKTDNQRRGGKMILDFWCMLHG